MVNKSDLKSLDSASSFSSLEDAERSFDNGQPLGGRGMHSDDGGSFSTAHMSMTVPDRIVLAGSEQHYELPSRPRELELDDQIYNNWSPSRIPISIQTPPRRLTLYDHAFPTADEENDNIATQQSSFLRQSSGIGDDDFEQHYQGGTPAQTPKAGQRERPQFRISSQQTTQTKPVSTKTTSEKRFLELYRRLETLEKDNQQRRYRELFIYTGFVGYLVYRGFSYMFGRRRPY